MKTLLQMIVLLLIMLVFGTSQIDWIDANVTNGNDKILTGQVSLKISEFTSIGSNQHQYNHTLQSDSIIDDYRAIVGLLGVDPRPEGIYINLKIQTEYIANSTLTVKVNEQSSNYNLASIRISYLLIQSSLSQQIFAIEEYKQINKSSSHLQEKIPTTIKSYSDPTNDIKVLPVLTGYRMDKFSSSDNYYQMSITGQIINSSGEYVIKAKIQGQNFTLQNAKIRFTTIFFNIRKAQLNNILFQFSDNQTIKTQKFYIQGNKLQGTQNQNYLFYGMKQIKDSSSSLSNALNEVYIYKLVIKTYKCLQPSFSEIYNKDDDVYCHVKCYKDNKRKYFNTTDKECRDCQYSCYRCENQTTCSKCNAASFRNNDQIQYNYMLCKPILGYYNVIGQYKAEPCSNVCGNGLLYDQSACPQLCDDNNTQDNDGCNKICQLQPGYRCDQQSSGSGQNKSVCYYNSSFQFGMKNLQKVDQENTLLFTLTISTLNQVVMQNLSQNWNQLIHFNIPYSDPQKYELISSSVLTTFNETSENLESRVEIQIKIEFSQKISSLLNLQLNFTPSVKEGKKFQNIKNISIIQNLIDQNKMKIQFYSDQLYNVSLAIEYILIGLSALTLLMALLSVIGIKIIIIQTLLVLQSTYFSIVGFVIYGGIPSIKAMSALKISALIIPLKLDSFKEYSWLGLSKSFIDNGVFAISVFASPFVCLAVCVVLSSVCLKRNEKALQVINIIKQLCIYEIPLSLYLCLGFNFTVSLGMSFKKLQENSITSNQIIIDIAFGTAFLLVGIVYFVLFWTRRRRFNEFRNIFNKNKFSKHWISLLFLYIFLNSLVVILMDTYWFSNLFTILFNVFLFAFQRQVKIYKVEAENTRSKFVIVFNLLVQILVMIEKLLIQFGSSENQTNFVGLFFPVVIVAVLILGWTKIFVTFYRQFRQKYLEIDAFMNEPSKKIHKNIELEVVQCQGERQNQGKNQGQNDKARTNKYDPPIEQKGIWNDKIKDSKRITTKNKPEHAQQNANIKTFKKIKQDLKSKLLCNLENPNPNKEQERLKNITMVEELLGNDEQDDLDIPWHNENQIPFKK